MQCWVVVPRVTQTQLTIVKRSSWTISRHPRGRALGVITTRTRTCPTGANTKQMLWNTNSMIQLSQDHRRTESDGRGRLPVHSVRQLRRNLQQLHLRSSGRSQDGHSVGQVTNSKQCVHTTNIFISPFSRMKLRSKALREDSYRWANTNTNTNTNTNRYTITNTGTCMSTEQWRLKLSPQRRRWRLSTSKIL